MYLFCLELSVVPSVWPFWQVYLTSRDHDTAQGGNLSAERESPNFDCPLFVNKALLE
jgi:hypothetical protein